MASKRSPSRRNRASQFRRDVLDNRRRLINSEARIEAEVADITNRLASVWRRELLRLSRSKTGSRRLADTRLRNTVARSHLLASLNKHTTATLRAANKKLGPLLAQTFRRESLRHTEFLQGVTVKANVTTGISFFGVNRRAMSSALRSEVPGRSLTNGFAKVSKKVAAMMRAQLAEAIANGWTVNELAEKWASFGKGPQAVATREATMLARTALMTASNNAALTLYKDNPRVVERVQWEATFDNRTCPTCGSYHGKQFSPNEAPPLPAHFNCRCAWLPVFVDAATELSFDRRAYINNAGETRFRRQDRRFELWLREQTDKDQRDYFGSALKFRAYRTNRIKFDDVVRLDGTLASDAEIARVIGDAKFVAKYRPDLVSKTGEVRAAARTSGSVPSAPFPTSARGKVPVARPVRSQLISEPPDEIPEEFTVEFDRVITDLGIGFRTKDGLYELVQYKSGNRPIQWRARDVATKKWVSQSTGSFARTVDYFKFQVYGIEPKKPLPGTVTKGTKKKRVAPPKPTPPPPPPPKPEPFVAKVPPKPTKAVDGYDESAEFRPYVTDMDMFLEAGGGEHLSEEAMDRLKLKPVRAPSLLTREDFAVVYESDDGVYAISKSQKWGYKLTHMNLDNTGPKTIDIQPVGTISLLQTGASRTQYLGEIVEHYANVRFGHPVRFVPAIEDVSVTIAKFAKAIEEGADEVTGAMKAAEREMKKASNAMTTIASEIEKISKQLTAIEKAEIVPGGGLTLLEKQDEIRFLQERYRVARQDMQAWADIHDKRAAEYIESSKVYRERIDNLLKVPPSHRISVRVGAIEGEARNPTIRDGAKWVEEHVSVRLLDGANPDFVQIVPVKGVRANYTSGSRKIEQDTKKFSNLLNVYSSERDTFIHEYGHHLEYTRRWKSADQKYAEWARVSRPGEALKNYRDSFVKPGFEWNKTKEWVKKRAPDEKPRKLNDILHRTDFRDDEIAVVDKFISPYVGKNYAHQSSEVVSMGMEYMANDPVGFFRKDPDHFEFTLRFMRGQL